MICNNQVSYFVESGIDYKEIMVKCGTTNPYGNRTICDDCQNNPREMESIRQHQANVDADNAWNRSAGYGEF